MVCEVEILSLHGRVQKLARSFGKLSKLKVHSYSSVLINKPNNMLVIVKL